MLEFIRYRKDYCIFVNIFEKSTDGLMPFINSFFVFVLIFTVIIIFMQAGLDTEDGEYLGLPFYI